MRQGHGGPLVVIVGSTGVGKTTLSLELAHHLKCEVVSADSRQIYRGMDIGTAKATPAEREQVPHHLLDLADPDQVITLAQYQSRAYQAVDAILARGHVPLLVGGTGLYVRAVVEGWTIPRVPPDRGLREDLERLAEEQGAEALHRRLAEVDPVSARRIDPRNVRRVIRALEVYRGTGRPFSAFQRREPPPYRILWIGLTMPRADLYRRLDRRIEAMLEAGLVEEVRSLLQAGYGLDLPAMSGVGYREIGRYLQGELDLDEAVVLMNRRTRRLVRHQYNWFRLEDPRIHWYDARRPETPQQVLRRVRDFLDDIGWHERHLCGGET